MVFGPIKLPPEMSQKQRSMLFKSMAPRPRKPSEMSQKKAPMFFKFMLPGFSQKLCLPRAFLKNLKGDKCDKAILNSPLGKSWHVKVCGGNACKWFGDGWFDFVQGHDLQLGECLVFRYDGDMVFYVIVFATSACEKRLPVFKKADKDDGKQRGIEDEKKTPLIREKVKDKGKQRGQHVSTVKINSFKKIKTEDGELRMYKTDFVGARHISKKQPSIAEEKRKAFEKANAFSRASKFPNFLKIMKKFSVGKCFTCFVMSSASIAAFALPTMDMSKCTFILLKGTSSKRKSYVIPLGSKGESMGSDFYSWQQPEWLPCWRVERVFTCSQS